MAAISPEPGLVVPYVYLWRGEFEGGEESGRKTRPAMVVLVIVVPSASRQRVVVCPFTTQQPDASRSAVPVPQRVMAHLGLDAARSWIICDEYNEFDWPGVDLEVTETGESAYGFAPDALVERVRAELRAARTRGALKPVPRTE